MELVMYAGNDCIASVSINPQRFSEPGYVGYHKRQLVDNNRSALQSITSEPEFLILFASTSTSRHKTQCSAEAQAVFH
jgi:hypothetical protein